MESNEPITAEEFLLDKEIININLYSPLRGEPDNEHKLSEIMHEYAVLFAKHHVREALQSASSHFEAYCNKHAIENAYREDQIV